jgi:hypothetical protein
MVINLINEAGHHEKCWFQITIRELNKVKDLKRWVDYEEIWDAHSRIISCRSCPMFLVLAFPANREDH